MQCTLIYEFVSREVLVVLRVKSLKRLPLALTEKRKVKYWGLSVPDALALQDQGQENIG